MAPCIRGRTLGLIAMSKAKQTTKEVKKPAAKSPKEKKAAKLAKKNGSVTTPIVPR